MATRKTKLAVVSLGEQTFRSLGVGKERSGDS